MTDTRIHRILAETGPVALPGVYDTLSARIAQRNVTSAVWPGRPKPHSISTMSRKTLDNRHIPLFIRVSENDRRRHCSGQPYRCGCAGSPATRTALAACRLFA